MLAGLEPKTQGDAVILTTNTEISIVPNLHQPRANARQNGHANRESTTVASRDLQARTSEVLRILPSRLCSSTKHPGHNGSELIGFVSSDTFALLQSEDNQGNSTFIHVPLRKLRSPHNPSLTAPERGVETSTRGPRLANGELPSKSRANNTMDVYVGIAKGLLAGHIVFPVLPEGLEEWDLVRYRYLLHPSSFFKRLTAFRLQRVVEALNRNSLLNGLRELPFHERIKFFRAISKCVVTRESRHLTLVGFEDVLKHCRTFCVRELLIQSLKKSCHGCEI